MNYVMINQICFVFVFGCMHFNGLCTCTKMSVCTISAESINLSFELLFER